jgi:hypothetical protein
MRHNMDILAETYIWNMKSIEDLIGKKGKTKSQCVMLN